MERFKIVILTFVIIYIMMNIYWLYKGVWSFSKFIFYFLIGVWILLLLTFFIANLNIDFG